MGMSDSDIMNLATGNSSTEPDNSDPWGKLSDASMNLPLSVKTPLALKGYAAGVQSGDIDPEEGLNRLVKHGIVPKGTKAKDLLKNTAPAPKAPVSLAMPTTPEALMQQQMGGIDKMRGLLQMGAQIKANDPVSQGMDFSPLARLADMENARNGKTTQLAAGMKAPESYEQIQKDSFDQNQALQKDSGDIQKTLYDNLKAKQQIAHQNAQEAHSNAMEKLMAQGLTLRGDAQTSRVGVMKDRLGQTANTAYDKVIGTPFENQILQSNRILGMIDQLKHADPNDPNEPVSSKAIRTDLAGALAGMITNKPASVYGMENSQMDNIYTKWGDLANTLSTAPGNTMTPESLQQLGADVKAMKNEYSSQHVNKFSSWIKGQPLQTRQLLTDRYQDFRDNAINGQTPNPTTSTSAANKAPLRGKTQDGKIGLFDPTTKVFLRYENAQP